MRKMSQRERILRHMQAHGSITPQEALALCGCMRLAARIKELRKQGHAISTTMVNEGNATFARYDLPTERSFWGDFNLSAAKAQLLADREGR